MVGKIAKEFIYGGHIQSLGASSIVFVASLLLGAPADFSVYVTVYLLFYALYVFNRFMELDDDVATNPERSRHFFSYRGAMPKIVVVDIVFFLAALFYFSRTGEAKALGIFLLLFGLLYTTYFKFLTSRIVAFKNFYVALFFASLVPFFMWYFDYGFSLRVWVLFAMVLVQGFLMQLVLDIKDVKSDAKKNLRTLARRWGREKTVMRAGALSLVNLLVVPVFFTLVLPLFPLSFLWLSLSLPFFLYALAKIARTDYQGYVLASGIFFFWGLVMLLYKSLPGL